MTKTRQTSLLAGIVIVGALAGSWFLLVTPKRHEATRLQTQAATLNQQAASLQTQITQLEAMRRQLPAKLSELRLDTARMPTAVQLPAFIRSLSASAGSAGLRLTAIQPGTPTLPVTPGTGARTGTGTATTHSAVAGLGATATGQFLEVPVQLSVRGNYWQVVDFLDHLESLHRAAIVSNLNATPTTATTSVPNALSVVIQVTIFEQYPGTAGAATAPTGGAVTAPAR